MLFSDRTIELWRQLGRVPPSELTDARIQLHWAAQIVMAVADAMLPQRADDSHSNLGWDDDHQALVGHRTPGRFSAALRMHDLTLLVLDTSDTIAEELPLGGRNLEEARRRMDRTVTDMAGLAPTQALAFRDYAMPDHAVRHGQPFGGEDPERLAQVVDWFSNINRALLDVQGQNPHASAVRCWPHHFDLATLISLDPETDPETARSINVGMSPGDASHNEPYLYVTPFPKPAGKVKTPDLPVGGQWQKRGFFAAVLSGSTLVESRNSNAQARAAQAFLDAAIKSCHQMFTP